MEKLLQYGLTGLSAGSLYALVALSIVLIARATRVLNFAQGDIATLAAFVAFTLLTREYGFPLALAASLFVGVAVGLLFYFVVLVPAQRHGVSGFGPSILTLALALIIQGVVVYVWGAQPVSLPFPISDTRVYRFGSVVVSQLSVATMAAGVVGSLGLYLLIQRTRLGLAMRAISENLVAAQTLGIPTRPILAAAWGIASLLGVVAGIFLAPTLLLDPFFMFDAFLKGFAAAVLGGMNSLAGAVLGGLILGVAEGLVGAYATIPFNNTVVFLIIIVVLLLRPRGLLGRAFTDRA